MIKLGMEGQFGWLRFSAYADSGAFVSIFSANHSSELGLARNQGSFMQVTVGDGKTIPVCVHRLNVQLGPYRFRARIGFSEKLGVGFNLLGRADFFTRFAVTFNDAERHVSFQAIRPRHWRHSGKILVPARTVR